MTRLPLHVLAALLILVFSAAACGPQDDTDKADDTASPADTGDTGAHDGMPADPSPFTLTVSGALQASLTFDSPSCTWPAGSSSFRSFWRSSTGEHAFVVVAEIVGDFQGAGSYDAAGGSASAKLQEEAGGEGHYFALDPNEGDSLTITIDYADQEEQSVWGEYSLSGMHGDGAITIDPQPIPIWCPGLN